MKENMLFSGESKNIEYKVTVPDKSEKYNENSGGFCQLVKVARFFSE